MKEAARMMLDLGCDYAINMDGGSPTQMIHENKVVLASRHELKDDKNNFSCHLDVSICVY